MPKKEARTNREHGDADWKISIDSSLQELGLETDEIKLYTASIYLGSTSIAAMARHLNLSRPSVYKLVGRLRSAGLAKLPDPHVGRTNFIVEPVTVILERLREKRALCLDLDHDLTAAMPDVLALYGKTARPASIRTFHGRAQLKRLHDSVLDDPHGDVRFFGSALTFIGILTPKEYARWLKRKIDAGIWNRILVPSTESRMVAPNPESSLREIRVFNGSQVFTTVFQLFAGKVIFWWPETLTALLIEDASLFKMMGSIFSTYWESGIPSRELFGEDGYRLDTSVPRPLA